MTLFWRAVTGLFTEPPLARKVWRSAADIGLGSLGIVGIISAATGMVITLQIGPLVRDLGVESQVGRLVAQAFLRELGPVLVGAGVTSRVGSAFAARIGTMKITEQLEALKTLAADPMHYLVGTELLAALFCLPVLAVFADLAGLLGGLAVSYWGGYVTPSTFFDSILVYSTAWDFLSGMLKTPVFAGIVICVAAREGFRTIQGALGVGRATTASVVRGTIAVFVANYVMSVIFYA